MSQREAPKKKAPLRPKRGQKEESEGYRPAAPHVPLLPETCEDLRGALYARKELLKDISRKISKIHDESLDDSAIRGLNDDINRQIRKKLKWDEALARLGHGERDRTARWGDETLPEPGNVHGYYYFGRAKQMPGVQDLLNPRREGPTKVSPRVRQMERDADGAYFGVLTPEEEQTRRAEEAEAEGKLCAMRVPIADWITGLPVLLPPREGGEEGEAEPVRMDIPTLAQVEDHLIAVRRKELLARFAQ